MRVTGYWPERARRRGLPVPVPGPLLQREAGGAGFRGSRWSSDCSVNCHLSPPPHHTHQGLPGQAAPQGSHRDPRPPGATRGCLSPSVSPRGSSPWLLPDGPHSCGSLPGPRVGEGQIPGAGASQKRGSVSLKRQRPQAPLAKLHGPWGLSEVHRSGDVKRGNVWEQVSGVRVQR